MLEDAIMLMKVSILPVDGVYLCKNLQKQAVGAEQIKGGHKGNTRAILPAHPDIGGGSPTWGSLPDPMPIFNKPKPKGATGQCFSCGQTGHYPD